MFGITTALKDGDTTPEQAFNTESKPQPAAAPALPTLSDDAFQKQKAAWQGVIESGKKSANDLIATIQTKTLLTDDQKMEIASWFVPQQPDADGVLNG